MTLLCVEDRDITLLHRRVQSLLVPVNHDSFYSGQVDRAIQRVAGEHYHRQVRDELPNLRDGDVFIARRERKRHGGQFDDVAFVVDDMVRSLSTIVLNGLRAMEAEGYSIIAMSAMRTGNKRGIIEPNLEETVRQIKLGFSQFATMYPLSTLEIIIAIDGPEEYVSRFRRFLFD